MEVACTGRDVALKYKQLLDCEANIAVIARQHAVLRAQKTDHDLSNLGDHRLRSHGGLSEQAVPLVMSVPVGERSPARTTSWRNFDVSNLVLNHGLVSPPG